jgi:hypothetical protein
MRYFPDTCVLYSLRKQATAAVVQKESSAVIKQVPSAATLDLACRTRKRRPPDNQPRVRCPDRS